MKTSFLLAVSTVAGVIIHFLGGKDAVLYTLLIFMIIDYLTGMSVALIFHKSNKTKSGRASSVIGFRGIAKKICELFLVGMCVRIDKIACTDVVRNIAVAFFTANEGLSILENAGLMGVRYPKKIKDMLEALKGDE